MNRVCVSHTVISSSRCTPPNPPSQSETRAFVLKITRALPRLRGDWVRQMKEWIAVGAGLFLGSCRLWWILMAPQSGLVLHFKRLWLPLCGEYQECARPSAWDHRTAVRRSGMSWAPSRKAYTTSELSCLCPAMLWEFALLLKTTWNRIHSIHLTCWNMMYFRVKLNIHWEII